MHLIFNIDANASFGNQQVVEEQTEQSYLQLQNELPHWGRDSLFQVEQNLSWDTVAHVVLEADGSWLKPLRTPLGFGPSGLSSQQQLCGDFIASFATKIANKGVVFGVGAVQKGWEVDGFDWAVYLTNRGNIRVYKKGVDQAGILGAYAVNDVFSIERNKDWCFLYKNGVKIYQQKVVLNHYNYLKVSLADVNSKISIAPVTGFSTGKIRLLSRNQQSTTQSMYLNTMIFKNDSILNLKDLQLMDEISLNALNDGVKLIAKPIMGPLPVKIVHFEIKGQELHVKLSEKEINEKVFLQFSQDGVSFDSFLNVENEEIVSLNKQGYYRLQVQGNEVVSFYSNIVYYEGSDTFYVYPNIIYGGEKVYFSHEVERCFLVNEFKRINVIEGETMDVQDFQAGKYQVDCLNVGNSFKTSIIILK